MKINLAGGTGIMGKVHKPVFEYAGHEVIISGRNSSPTLETAAEFADLTIVSVPIRVTSEIIGRVAPYSNAIMDMTGLKRFPIEDMLKYARPGAEVGGLHPLYGEVSNIKGRTVIYCPTSESGEKCDEVLQSLRLAGAKIKEMGPKRHDLMVGGIAQNARIKLMETFGVLIEHYGITINELYEISSSPTRIILDLLARQVSEQNDALYDDMRKFNPTTDEVTSYLKRSLQEDGKKLPSRLRSLFGESLESYQQRAKSFIEGYPKE